MGEYATRVDADGKTEHVLKIGTCEMMYYVRRDELEAGKAQDAGRGTNVQAVLDWDKVTYRFPWPDEDGGYIGGASLDKREPFRTVVLHDAGLDIDHQEMTQSVHPRGQQYAYNVNVRIPCPRSKSLSHAPDVLQIVGDRYKDGKRRTVLRCGYCEAEFPVSAAELAKLRDVNRKGPALEAVWLIAAHDGPESEDVPEFKTCGSCRQKFAGDGFTAWGGADGVYCSGQCAGSAAYHASKQEPATA